MGGLGLCLNDCRHKLYPFTVANTCFTSPLRCWGKTKFATVKWYNLLLQIIQSQMRWTLFPNYPCWQKKLDQLPIYIILDSNAITGKFISIHALFDYSTCMHFYAFQVVLSKPMSEVARKIVPHVRLALLTADELEKTEKDNRKDNLVPVSFAVNSFIQIYNDIDSVMKCLHKLLTIYSAPEQKTLLQYCDHTLSVIIVNFHIFDFFSESTEWILVKLVRKQELNILHHVCVLGLYVKMAILASDCLRHNQLLCNRWTNFEETW